MRPQGIEQGDNHNEPDKDPQWTAAAWLLERKYPDEYAQTTRKAEADADDTPHITLGVEVRVAGDDGDGDD